MLELKLAGLSSLDYADFWRLFGEGFIPNFSSILDTKLSPYMSPFAYHFWKETAGFKNLFKTGCSGLAIRVFQFVIRIRGLQSAVERLCSASTIEEQVQIWEKDLRPHFLSKWLISLLNNDRFLWGALGVPPAQVQMILEEGACCFVLFLLYFEHCMFNKNQYEFNLGCFLSMLPLCKKYRSDLNVTH
jgi:betaine lipid synthase